MFQCWITEQSQNKLIFYWIKCSNIISNPILSMVRFHMHSECTGMPHILQNGGFVCHIAGIGVYLFTPHLIRINAVSFNLGPGWYSASLFNFNTEITSCFEKLNEIFHFFFSLLNHALTIASFKLHAKRANIYRIKIIVAYYMLFFNQFSFP